MSFPLSTVITNAGRPDMLYKAFKSVRAAGIENIVIVSAAINSDVEAVHALIKKDYPQVNIVALKGDPGCNASWMEGVKAATTEWVHILHDDDLVLPEFRKTIEPLMGEPLLQFFFFDAASHSPNGGRLQEHCKLWDKPTARYACSTIKQRVLIDDMAISPVAGVFKRKHLISVLAEFQRTCAKRPEFIIRENMQVGNDMLIWLRASELHGVFQRIAKPLVSYGNHPGSTTCNDHRTKANKLPAIYKALKEYWKSSPAVAIQTPPKAVVAPKIATFCYLPDVDKSIPFLKHLNSFKRSFPLHLITDKKPKKNDANLTVIPKLGPFTELSGCMPSDQYAMMAFLHTIKRAVELKLDHFILIENDCRFTQDHWDGQMWESFAKNPNSLFGGTPVCWHPWSQGEKVSRAIIDYAFRYQQASKVAMAFEGEHNGRWGLAVYPNGALAVYTVSELYEYFHEPLRDLEAPLARQAEMCTERHAFDLHIGRRMIKKFGTLEALKRITPIPSVFSGCGSHHARLEDRLDMFRTKRKAAVHQIKENIYA